MAKSFEEIEDIVVDAFDCECRCYGLHTEKTIKNQVLLLEFIKELCEENERLRKQLEAKQ